jgi:hypothetical protein
MNFYTEVINEVNRADKEHRIKQGLVSSFSSSMEKLVRNDPWDKPRVVQLAAIAKPCIKCGTGLIPEGAKRNITPSFLKKSYYLCNGCSATKVRERYKLHKAVISLQRQIRRKKVKLAKLLGGIGAPSS